MSSGAPRDAVATTLARFPGAEVVDIRAAAADAPAAALANKAAPAPVTLREMAALVEAEAERIGITQAHLIERGLRQTPAPTELRRREIFEAIGRLVDMVQSDSLITDRLRELVGKRRAALAAIDAAAKTPEQAT